MRAHLSVPLCSAHSQDRCRFHPCRMRHECLRRENPLKHFLSRHLHTRGEPHLIGAGTLSILYLYRYIRAFCSIIPALKSSPSKKGRSALLAPRPLGPSAAFSAGQIPTEQEEGRYDLRGVRSYPTLEDDGQSASTS